MLNKIVEVLTTSILWPFHVDLRFGLNDQQLGFEPLFLVLRQQEVFSQFLLFSVVGCYHHSHEQIQNEKAANHNIGYEKDGRPLSNTSHADVHLFCPSHCYGHLEKCENGLKNIIEVVVISDPHSAIVNTLILICILRKAPTDLKHSTSVVSALELTYSDYSENEKEN